MGVFITQPSFALGEIAADLQGRVDQSLYYSALNVCVNFIVDKFGGVYNRPGTKVVNEVKDSTKEVRVIGFEFNEVQTYMLEFGDLYMRVIVDGAHVLETPLQTITAITKADPAVVTAGTHGYSDGDDVFIDDVLGMVEVNARTFRVANKTATTFELTDFQGNNIDSSDFAAYASAGTSGKLFTLVTPYTESVLFDLDYTQSNDVLSITHKDFATRDITRTANDVWTIAKYPHVGGPFQDINADLSINVIASATTGAITLTANTALFNSGEVGDLFFLQQELVDTTKRWEPAKAISTNGIRRSGASYYKATNTKTTGTVPPSHIEGTELDGDDGVSWEYLHSGFGVAEITAFTSTTVVDATVTITLPDLTTSVASTVWAKAAWSAGEGFPASCGYHKQRFWLGGTVNLPNGLWASKTGLRLEQSVSNPLLDDDAMRLALDTVKVNAVRHLIPLKRLIALTGDSEHSVTGIDGVISATDIPIADVESYVGSSKTRPVLIGDTAVFVQDAGNELRGIAFNQTEAGGTIFAGTDLSGTVPHFFRGKEVVDIDYHRIPYSVIWVVQDSGDLQSLTYRPENNVLGWARHETDGTFESVSTIREGNEHASYFVTKRTIDGVDKRFVERLQSRNFNTNFVGKRENITDDQLLARILGKRDAYFVDSGKTFDGRNTGAITMTVTGGSTWDTPEVLTITASAPFFKLLDVNDQIVFWRLETIDNERVAIAYRLDISAFTSSTIVSAIPTKALPVSLQGVATADWEFAQDLFFPLHHLEGKEVAVLADGNVVPDITVTDGQITLPAAAAVVHVGLAYTCDIEALDLAAPTGARKATTNTIPRVFVTVQESVSISAGINDFQDLEPFTQRLPETGYDASVEQETALFEIQVNSNLTRTSRVAIRQVNPLPLTVNAITPDVQAGTD